MEGRTAEHNFRLGPKSSSTSLPLLFFFIASASVPLEKQERDGKGGDGMGWDGMGVAEIKEGKKFHDADGRGSGRRREGRNEK